MSLSVAELTLVIQELSPTLLDSWIQKIHEPHPGTLTLDIHKPGATQTLLICVTHTLARIHFTDRSFANPPSPPPFCEFLRSKLQGGRIAAVRQIPDDRIVVLDGHTKQERWSLVIALIGRDGNVWVLDRDGKILHSLHPGKMKPGELFLPPSQNTRNAEQALSRSIQVNRLAELSARVRDEDVSAFVHPMSKALDQMYTDLEQRLAEEQQQHEQLSSIRESIKKTQRLVDRLQAELDRVERYAKYRQYGELLKHYLSKVRRGQNSITVINYFDESLSEVILPLDPEKDAQGNLKSYFNKFQKYIGAQREIRPRLEKAKNELAELRRSLALIEQGRASRATRASIPIHAKHAGLKTAGSIQTSRIPHSRSLPYRKYQSVDGLPILVGKNARDNDELTFRVARHHDLWLHARGIPGSHVVLQLEKGQIPPPESLKDAALLALFYSDLKKSGKGEVIYTLRKYVRKAKGQKAGAVHVTQDKSLWVNIDPKRLARLKRAGRERL